MPLGGRRGLSSITEELPSLLVVVLGISIFIASAADAYMARETHEESERLRQRADELAKIIRNWGAVSAGEDGVLDGARLMDVTGKRLKEDFEPEVQGLGFRVAFHDTGTYAKKYNKVLQTSRVPEDGDVAVVYSSVAARDPNGNLHPMQLIVKVWRVET